MSVNVLIVDDHEVVRSGLSTLFEGSPVKVVAEAADGKEAVNKAQRHRPDVVLLDIRMEEHSGFDALDQLHQKVPGARVVVLSTYDNPTYIARAVALGASDYMLKGSSRRDLIAAIEGAAGGQGPSKKGAMRSVAETMNSRKLGGDDIPLTQRETQVLRHIALGLSNKEIAKSLSISVETVKEHVQNILRKIECTDRTHAAVWAIKKNLV